MEGWPPLRPWLASLVLIMRLSPNVNIVKWVENEPRLPWLTFCCNKLPRESLSWSCKVSKDFNYLPFSPRRQKGEGRQGLKCISELIACLDCTLTFQAGNTDKSQMNNTNKGRGCLAKDCRDEKLFGNWPNCRNCIEKCPMRAGITKWFLTQYWPALICLFVSVSFLCISVCVG